MITPAQRRLHEKWLLEITGIPTATGHEDRVVAWVRQWLKARRGYRLTEDRAGNLLITQARKATAPPVVFTAHMDHPAFVVREVVDRRHLVMEFRGGVHPPYFQDASIVIYDDDDLAHRAKVVEFDPAAKPYKLATVRLSRPAPHLGPGQIGRWALRGVGATPVVRGGHLRAPACDDLAGAAAALAALDILKGCRGCGHAGVLLTRAEEVGFIGTIAAARARTVSKDTRLICLETSRSFPESPIGAGPIVRVGDRLSVFSPKLTNLCSQLATDYAREQPGFAWQRKLMAGGACEATAFAGYGYDATCLCVALGNYHNMADIDGVLAGKTPARVAPEFISMSDWRGLVELLVHIAASIDAKDTPSIRDQMTRLFKTHGGVLDQ